MIRKECMKLAIIYILTLIVTTCFSQVSIGYWVAKGTDATHHYENVYRAYKGIYGKMHELETSINIPDGYSYIFDIGKSNNYILIKHKIKTKEGLETFVVFSKKDNEYEYVTSSRGYVILYKFRNEGMVIYRLKQ